LKAHLPRVPTARPSGRYLDFDGDYSDHHVNPSETSSSDSEINSSSFRLNDSSTEECLSDHRSELDIDSNNNNNNNDISNINSDHSESINNNDSHQSDDRKPLTLSELFMLCDLAEFRASVIVSNPPFPTETHVTTPRAIASSTYTPTAAASHPHLYFKYAYKNSSRSKQPSVEDQLVYPKIKDTKKLETLRGIYNRSDDISNIRIPKYSEAQIKKRCDKEELHKPYKSLISKADIDRIKRSTEASKAASKLIEAAKKKTKPKKETRKEMMKRLKLKSSERTKERKIEKKKKGYSEKDDKKKAVQAHKSRNKLSEKAAKETDPEKKEGLNKESIKQHKFAAKLLNKRR
jgi:hypothetical protein